MNSATLLVALALSIVFIWYTFNVCVFCKTVLTDKDKTSSGRVRWRKAGTQLPVCSCCGNSRRGEVD